MLDTVQRAGDSILVMFQIPGGTLTYYFGIVDKEM